ncbi:MAG: leucine-rich repeat domain-containing protein [Pirellulales bacterium]
MTKPVTRQMDGVRSGHGPWPGVSRRAVLWRFVCAAAFALFVASRGLAAEEMTEAEAIAELQRLGAYLNGIDTVAAGKREIARATGANLGAQHAHEKMRLLKHLPWLETVTAYAIEDTDLEDVQRLPRLRSLGIRNSSITEKGIAHLLRLAALRELYVERTNITEAGIAELGKLRNLTHLWLSGSDVDDAAIMKLAALAKLETLLLSNCRVSGAGLASLRGLAHLTRLTVSSPEVRDGAIGELRGLRLTELHIGDAITDAGLSDLRAFPELRSLILDGLPITDAGLAHLGALGNLESLGLNGTSITDAGIEKLAGLTNLRRLGLNGTKITDAGLEKLLPPHPPSSRANRSAERKNAGVVGLSSLVELRLEGTAITDAGLKCLAKFDDLSVLYLRGTKVSDKGMDDLQRARGVSIRSWPREPGAGGAGGRVERPLPPDVVRDRDTGRGAKTRPSRERARNRRRGKGDD